MALARRASLSFPRQWSPRMVPTWPVEVNWGHPLAAGLVYLVVPGSMRGLIDLTGNVKTLTQQSSASFAQTAVGPGFSGRAANQGAYVSGIPTALALTTSGTLHWGGSIVGAGGPYNPPLIGVLYGNADVAPYTSYSLGNGNTLYFGYNNGSGSTIAPISLVTADTTVTSYSLSFTIGGSVILYGKGQQITSASLLSGSIAYGSSPTLCVNTYYPDPARTPNSNTAIAGIYNYALPPGLMAWLNAEPFAMLRPIVRRSYSYAGALLRRRPLIVAGF